MSINRWPSAERPREKLLSKGAQVLSDAELLAVFLRTGVKGKTAIDLARELLVEFSGVYGLLNSSRIKFKKINGLGDAKYASIQAIFELSRRALQETLHRNDTLTSPEATRKFLQLSIGHEKREVFWCLFLDNQNHVIQSEALFYGSIDGANVYPREVVKTCLKYNASAVIFAHNHPSGSIEPSQADIRITKQLKEALSLVDVRVLDHIVVARNESKSMAELGLL